VHLGGVAHTGLRSQTEREQAYAVNAGGTRSLLEAARESGVQRFLFMSSAHVYAGQHGLNINEDSPTADDSDYARIKLEAEAAVQEAVERGLSAVILRPCLTYGPGVRFNLKSLMQAVRRGYYIHPGASDVLRSFASVDTVTAAVVHLLGTRQFNGTYNVADHRPVVLRQWVDNLARLMQARRPRTLPLHVFRVLAAAGSTIAALGLPAPLTQVSLRKLTTSFSLDVNKLAATGFVWPETNGDVLKKMVEAECTTG
jgi:nucleoside-diphosphate-sugar epimerase